MKKKLHYYENAMKRCQEQSHYKQLRCVVPLDESHILTQESKYVNFNSNDYLGLSRHPYVKKNAIKFVLEWGVGSTASRVLTDHLLCNKSVEEKLAKLLNFETVLLFNSGFQANSALLSALCGPKSFIFIDRLCHNSLFQGTTLSQAKIYRYAHNDTAHLKTLLEKTASLPCDTKIIVSESVFSVEGDECPLKDLISLAEEFNALLYIDDAHALGVLGKRGMGLCAYRKGIDIAIGTFGKACGSFGAYVACSELIRAYLTHFCPGFMNSTTLPPAVLGAIDAALDLIPDMEAERKHIFQKSETLRETLKRQGWPCGSSSTHIIPLILGTSEETLRLSEWLTKQNILAYSIRPPLVPPGTSRIRIAISVMHETSHIKQLVQSLLKWKREPFIS